VFYLPQFNVKHIFHNVHNFVNNLVQFYAQIVFNCEARRLKQFVGSAYKKYKYFIANVLYSTADAAVEERLSFLRATAEERSFSRWQSTDWAQTTAEQA
jgi:hypothetical protein